MPAVATQTYICMGSHVMCRLSWTDSFILSIATHTLFSDTHKPQSGLRPHAHTQQRNRREQIIGIILYLLMWRDDGNARESETIATNWLLMFFILKTMILNGKHLARCRHHCCSQWWILTPTVGLGDWCACSCASLSNRKFQCHRFYTFYDQ